MCVLFGANLCPPRGTPFPPGFPPGLAGNFPFSPYPGNQLARPPVLTNLETGPPAPVLPGEIPLKTEYLSAAQRSALRVHTGFKSIVLAYPENSINPGTPSGD